ncbi:MAG: winged helix-turn-helix domain-containing protein [Candidatus Hodarchaeota archaeon]
MIDEEIVIIEIDAVIKQLELLLDSQRAKIYSYISLKGKATTEELVDIMNINRSTLSYHLTKMVNAGILEVAAPQTGRFLKIYSESKVKYLKLNLDMKELLKTKDDQKIRQYLRLIVLEHRFYATRAELALKAIKDELLSFKPLEEEDILSIAVKGKTGFIPRIWKGILTEQQAKYVNRRIRGLISEAIEKHPDEDKHHSRSNYIALLSLFPLF